mmetsp:Transcript_46247/g.77101  ORF Transcript_46247/g.77101 Transcript_46247/m.77101 type:complete len:192 (-) Transcript_46247:125-700(-)
MFARRMLQSVLPQVYGLRCPPCMGSGAHLLKQTFSIPRLPGVSTAPGQHQLLTFRRGFSAKASIPVNTHLSIDQKMCGTPEELWEGRATVRMTTIDLMAADARGLTHGGFYFGMADYAAMLAVNDPNVVLGAAETRFLKPVQTGDDLLAQATIIGEKGKKRIVEVSVSRGEEIVFDGTFTCFVLPTHVFDA